jgi:sec-independent protein translocase protein TatB
VLNLDPAKLLVIGMIALVVLGPERLPKVARQLGGAWRELTRLRDQVHEEVRTAFPVDDLPKIPSPTGALSDAISSFTRPLVDSVTPRPNADPSESAGAEDGARMPMAEEGSEFDRPAAYGGASTRRDAPGVVIHPALGEFAFLPDDPGMN